MNSIDISHILDENTPVYPEDSKTRLSEYKNLEKDGYTGYLLQTGLHSGTHIDVPMHLTTDKRAISDFSLERFMGSGVLLDVRGERCISMRLEYKEIVKENSIVLLYTGFDQYYLTPEYFSKHPTIDDSLTEFFITKKIKMLGMDIPSPDYFPFPVHTALFKSDIFLLENLTNLQRLLKIPNFDVIALPLKLKAEASPVRAICRIRR